LVTWFAQPPWHSIAGLSIALAGIAAFYGAVRLQVVSWKEPREVEKTPLVLVSAIRLAVLGACLFAFSAGWVLEQTWVMVLAAVIGGEELLETSVAASALKE